jgi:aerobic-type carbon monoxide dehydrogenase small subunit (CoxS/CutS family)
MRRRIEFMANGAAVAIDVDPTQPLLEVVRDPLGFLGARRGCETAYCGACTVLVDGRAVRSCVFLAARVAGHKLTTIEGLARGGALDPLQQAFIEHGALECGYCIPGMILLAKSALASMPNATDADIRRALSSNLCRCTGYVKIIEAVKAVAQAAVTETSRG